MRFAVPSWSGLRLTTFRSCRQVARARGGPSSDDGTAPGYAGLRTPATPCRYVDGRCDLARSLMVKRASLPNRSWLRGGSRACVPLLVVCSAVTNTGGGRRAVRPGARRTLRGRRSGPCSRLSGPRSPGWSGTSWPWSPSWRLPLERRADLPDPGRGRLPYRGPPRPCSVDPAGSRRRHSWSASHRCSGSLTAQRWAAPYGRRWPCSASSAGAASGSLARAGRQAVRRDARARGDRGEAEDGAGSARRRGPRPGRDRDAGRSGAARARPRPGPGPGVAGGHPRHQPGVARRAARGARPAAPGDRPAGPGSRAQGSRPGGTCRPGARRRPAVSRCRCRAAGAWTSRRTPSCRRRSPTCCGTPARGRGRVPRVDGADNGRRGGPGERARRRRGRQRDRPACARPASVGGRLTGPAAASRSARAAGERPIRVAVVDDQALVRMGLRP